MKSWKYNIAANVLGKVSGVLFNFIFTPLYVHILGIESFSLVAFFSSLVAMTYVLDMTFGATMTRELAQAKFSTEGPDGTRDLARSLEVFYIGASIVLAAICIFSAPWIAAHWLKVETLPLPMVRQSIAMMGICVALQAPMTIYSGGLYGLERQTLYNMVSVLLAATRGIGAVAVIWFVAATPVAFFSWQIVFGVLQLSCFSILFWRCMPKGTRHPHFSVPAIRRVARFASGMAATGVVTFFLSQFNSILMSRILPLSRLGVFQIANQVNTSTRLLGGPIESAILPRLSFHVGAKDEISFGKIYHEACQFMAVMVLPAATIIAVFSWGLINAWISSEKIADQAAPVATVLVLGSLLNNLLRVPYQVTLAKGWSMWGFYSNLIAVTAFVPLLLFLAVKYGMLGAAFAWLILNTGYVVIGSPILHSRMLPGHFKPWIVGDILVPVVTAALAAFALRGIISEHLPRFQFIAAVAVGWVASTLICAMAMRHTRDILLRLSGRTFERLIHA